MKKLTKPEKKPLEKTPTKPEKKPIELDTIRRDLIKRIYSQYIPTYNTALDLSLHMDRAEKRRIKRVVTKSIFRDIRRARKVERQNARKSKTRKQKIIEITLILLFSLIFIIFLSKIL